MKSIFLSAVFILSVLVSFGQEHDRSEKIMYLIDNDDAPSFYYDNDDILYSAYVIKEVDKQDSPLSITIKAMNPESYDVTTFRYNTNTGHMTAADIDKLSGKKVMIRYHKVKEELVALKISTIE